MAFFAQTGPNAQARLSQLLGQSIGQGTARNFATPETRVAEKRLSEAFQNIPEGATLQDIYKIAGPKLATTPGGMELLDRYADVSKQQAISKAHQELREKNPISQSNKAGYEKKENIPTERLTPEQPQSDRYKAPYASLQSTFPEPITNMKEVPLPTIDDMDKWKRDYNDQLAAQGIPPNEMAAEDYSRQRMNQVYEQNRAIREDKDVIAREQERRVNNGLQYAQKQGIINESAPEEERVFKHLLTKFQNAPSEIDQYNQARQEFGKFENARDSLNSFYDQPGFATKLWRQLNGTYKDKQQALKDIQPGLQYFKDNGLYDEARLLLMKDMGFGPEDAERALFEPSKSEINDLSLFQSQKKPVNISIPGKESTTDDLQRLPIMNEKDFNIFTNDLSDYLKNNPNANLLALRGNLMEKNNISWNDLNKAITQLMRNDQFKPVDPIQEYQLNLLRAAPVPSLGKIFEFAWRDTR